MANIVFNFTDVTSTPLESKKVTLHPFSFPSLSGNNIAVGNSVTGSTDSNGSVSFSNVVPNIYEVEINGPNVASSFYIQVPSGSSTLNGSDIALSSSLNHLVISSSANVTFNLIDVTSTPFAVKTVSLTPVNNATTVLSGSVATGDKVSENTDSTGSVIFENLVPTVYKVECVSPQKVTTFNITVPSNGGDLNAKDLLTIPITNTLTYDPNNINTATLAYSMAVSDELFALKSDVVGSALGTGSSYPITSSWSQRSISSSFATKATTASFSQNAGTSITASFATKANTSVSASWASASISASYAPLSPSAQAQLDAKMNGTLPIVSDFLTFTGEGDSVSIYNDAVDGMMLQTTLGFLNISHTVIAERGFTDLTATTNSVVYYDQNKKLTSSGISPTVLNNLSGSTSNIQSQINSKQNSIVTGSTLPITSSQSVSSSYSAKADTATSSSFASTSISASWAPAGTSLITGSTYPITSSVALNALSASHSINSSFSDVSTVAVSASWASESISSSYVPNVLHKTWGDVYVEWFEDPTGIRLHSYTTDQDIFYTENEALYVTQLIYNNATPNTVLVTDGSKNVLSSTVTDTELLNLSGTTSNIQTQLDGKQDALTTGSTLPITSSNAVTASYLFGKGEIDCSNNGTLVFNNRTFGNKFTIDNSASPGASLNFRYTGQSFDSLRISDTGITPNQIVCSDVLITGSLFGTSSNAVTASVLQLTPQIVSKQTNTNYTLQVGDNGKVLNMNSTASVVVTVPSGSLNIGFSCTILQSGTGSVSITGSNAGITIGNSYNYKTLNGQYSVANVFCYDTGSFLLTGDLIP